jgi:hypothetical protein
VRGALSETHYVTENAELVTYASNKGSILPALFPQTVIDVARFDMEIEEPANFKQAVQKRRGIFTTRESYENPLALGNTLLECCED